MSDLNFQTPQCFQTLSTPNGVEEKKKEKWYASFQRKKKREVNHCTNNFSLHIQFTGNNFSNALHKRHMDEQSEWRETEAEEEK